MLLKYIYISNILQFHHTNIISIYVYIQAYASVLGQEPGFTNYTGHFKGALDYIWYSADRLAPTAVLDIPSQEEMDEILGTSTAMPCSKYPSDHFSMCCDFSFIDRSAMAMQQ